LEAGATSTKHNAEAKVWVGTADWTTCVYGNMLQPVVQGYETHIHSLAVGCQKHLEAFTPEMKDLLESR